MDQADHRERMRRSLKAMMLGNGGDEGDADEATDLALQTAERMLVALGEIPTRASTPRNRSMATIGAIMVVGKTTAAIVADMRALIDAFEQTTPRGQIR